MVVAMPVMQAEETLWRDYRAQLLRFVVKRVADPATAEDIVHDVLVRVYQRRDTLRDGQKFEPWLYQITRNAVIDYYRARRMLEEKLLECCRVELDSRGSVVDYESRNGCVTGPDCGDC